MANEQLPRVRFAVPEDQRCIVVLFALELECPVPVLEAMMVCAWQRVTVIRPFWFAFKFYEYGCQLIGPKIQLPYFQGSTGMSKQWSTLTKSRFLDLVCQSNGSDGDIVQLVLSDYPGKPQAFLKIHCDNNVLSISTNKTELRLLQTLDIHSVLCPIIEEIVDLFNAPN